MWHTEASLEPFEDRATIVVLAPWQVNPWRDSPTWPGVTLSPSPPRALQQERLRLDRRKDAPRQWEGQEAFIHYKHPWAPRGAHG